ncbi:MAG: glycosyltransferase family 4 protein [Tistlia sp.]|uniref:glycosyltransferase family 4 protein n=1 Tax=Tistlia sp. TaxID=3057121 RepID=UPI0034A203F0
MTRAGTPLAFAVPGRLETLTGGFLYDRRILEGLRARGRAIEVLELPEGFPLAGPELLAEAAARLDALPDGCPLVVDGLAAGVMPEAMARLGRRLPLHILVHHPLAAETGLTPAQAQALRDSERRSLAEAQVVVTTSRATAEGLRRDYAVPAARLRVVPPGTERASLATGSAAGAPPHLLSVGALIPRKGQDLLVEALGRLAALPWRLTLAGAARDAAFAARLRARIAALGLAGRIRLPGEVEAAELAPLYDSADLFVLPSRLEGYGMAIAEALARGLPVVCGDSAAIVGELPPGSLASLATADPDALAGTLEALLAEPQRRRALAAAARRARELLPSWDEATLAFERALAEPWTARPAAGGTRTDVGRLSCDG